jgi:hypothetical protein
MADLDNDFPIISHESAGVDCIGCIVVKVSGNDAELRCNECGAVVGVVQLGVLSDLVSLVK